MQSFDRFIGKAFVINLEHRLDRRRETEAELRRIGFTRATFFPATKPKDAGLFKTPGERGCFESHIAIWRASIGARNVLVMEDDIQFTSDFCEKIQLLQNLPDKWSIIYLGYDQLPSVARPLPSSGLVQVGSEFEFIGTHCYILNGASLQSVVDACLDISSRRGESGYAITIDGAINLTRKRLDLISFALAPPIAVQRSSMTDVSDPKWFDRIPLINVAVRQLRRLNNMIRRYKSRNSGS